jgi:hypothetical protein
MYADSYVVSSLIATFRVPYAPRWKKALARLPLIALLAAFSLTSVAFLKLFDVDAIGPRIFVDVTLVAALGAILLTLLAAAFFVLTGAVERSAGEAAAHPISWRGTERILIAIALAALVAKLVLSV